MNNPVATILKVTLIATIAMLVVCLPLSNSNELMNGIQTAKSFNFFYSMMGLLALSGLAILFSRRRIQFRLTWIDLLLLLLVLWITVNKYWVHEIHCLSLSYFELLGLSVLYIIIRFINPKYYTFFLIAICISGAIQAIYGNLQLWGFYPSYHGLFKMTGSFFNPGPYAGYLCAVLPVAVGLYWSFDSFKFQVSSFRKNFRLQVSSFKSILAGGKPELEGNQKLEASTGEAQPETLNLKPVIIKCISVTTIITILLILPAARSRAAWLGAIAGVAYLAWHKYNIANWLKHEASNSRSVSNAQHQTAKPSNKSRCTLVSNAKHRTLLNLNLILNLNLNTRLRKWLTVSVLVIFVISAGIGLYHFKKDSADGRMLIWTVTANIIKDNPILGVGQDMFKAHYMDYQAAYFRKNPDSKYEQLADDNQYAFNEPINIWAENGIVGILLAAGIVFSVFFTPIKNYKFRKLNYKFQVSSSRLSNEQNDSKFQVPSFRLSNEQLETPNLKRRSTKNSKLKPETIIRAAILAILVFGLFTYPSEILPIKIVAITCLGLLANCLALNTSNAASSYTSGSNIHEANIKREASNRETSNGEAIKHEVLNGSVKHGIWNLKPVITVFSLFLVVFAYTQTNKIEKAYKTWKGAYDLYNYGHYENCLSSYEQVYPFLNRNGAFLLNYGKALSVAGEHKLAINILKQSQSYLHNTITYTAIGDSYQRTGMNKKTEDAYLKAHDMVPGRFYPQYLLAKHYESIGRYKEAVELAKTLILKEPKTPSIAVDEIKENMQVMIERFISNKNNEYE